MVYFVYIIYSPSKQKFYTGSTINIDRRLKQHNQRLSNTRTTKYITDFVLIHCEVVDGLLGALKLEKYFKSGSGREIRSEIVKYIHLGA